MGFASAGHTVLSVLCLAETGGFARLEAMYCRTPLQPNNEYFCVPFQKLNILTHVFDKGL